MAIFLTEFFKFFAYADILDFVVALVIVAYVLVFKVNAKRNEKRAMIFCEQLIKPLFIVLNYTFVRKDVGPGFGEFYYIGQRKHDDEVIIVKLQLAKTHDLPTFLISLFLRPTHTVTISVSCSHMCPLVFGILRKKDARYDETVANARKRIRLTSDDLRLFASILIPLEFLPKSMFVVTEVREVLPKVLTKSLVELLLLAESCIKLIQISDLLDYLDCKRPIPQVKMVYEAKNLSAASEEMMNFKKLARELTVLSEVICRYDLMTTDSRERGLKLREKIKKRYWGGRGIVQNMNIGGEEDNNNNNNKSDIVVMIEKEKLD